MEPKPTVVPKSAPLDPEDYYFDGPYLVFTAAYHLKRGVCCGSGCRHCPYKEIEKEKGSDAQLPPPDGA
jgi:hypothetical protein